MIEFPKFSHSRYYNTYTLEFPITWVSRIPEQPLHRIPLNMCWFIQIGQCGPLLIFMTSNISTILFMLLSLEVPKLDSYM
jgi:hypothetical protein